MTSGVAQAAGAATATGAAEAADPAEVADASLTRSELTAPGIRRRRSGRGFRYFAADGKPLADAVALARIKALVIPPAWEDVWICPRDDGHIQAVGTDVAGRRQYRYHDRWRDQQDREKFDRMLEFGHALPRVRTTSEQHLRGRELSRERVLAAAVRLIDLGFFRPGSDEYAAGNGTFGLATIRREHVTCHQDEIAFEYVGKSGKRHLQSVADDLASPVVRSLKRRRSFPECDDLLVFRSGGRWHNVTAPAPGFEVACRWQLADRDAAQMAYRQRGIDMQIGYKLTAEAFGPKELIRQAVLAEQAGFDFVEMSDHYHPWLEAQGHSPFTWSVLPAIAAKTERIGLVTGVTCPSVRYHPAIIAQAAATLAIISDGRFTLGVGAGERLNEHVVGTGFPARRVRHERFREALEIIRLLWKGGYRSYDGKYLQLEDARVFDLPAEPAVIAVAASGPESASIAAELGDGLFATEPDAELVNTWRRLGGHGPAYSEMPLAWAQDEDAAVAAVLEKSSFALTGWKVMAELPNPVNFEAATASIGPEQVREQFACGPDVKRHLQVAQQFVDAGFDHLVAMNAGPDPDGFIDFFASELAAPLRALTPSKSA